MSLSNVDMSNQAAAAMALESRAAPRFALLIRPAKLKVGHAEYACVLRDISATGASIRMFHEINWNGPIVLEHQTGDRMAAQKVWTKELDSGLHFHEPINVETVLNPCSLYPKRDIRYNIDLPITVKAGGQIYPATMKNLSRQGGMIEGNFVLAIDQVLVIEAKGLPRIEARVRWRKDGRHGLIFDTTFTLGQLALVLQKLNQNSPLRP